MQPDGRLAVISRWAAVFPAAVVGALVFGALGTFFAAPIYTVQVVLDAVRNYVSAGPRPLWSYILSDCFAAFGFAATAGMVAPTLKRGVVVAFATIAAIFQTAVMVASLFVPVNGPAWFVIFKSLPGIVVAIVTAVAYDPRKSDTRSRYRYLA